MQSLKETVCVTARELNVGSNSIKNIATHATDITTTVAQPSNFNVRELAFSHYSAIASQIYDQRN